MTFRPRRARVVLFGSALALTAFVPLATPAASAVNLVANPGLESLSKGFPKCWMKWGTGRNTATTKAVGGAHKGKRAVAVKVTKLLNGQRNIIQTEACAPKVKPGQNFDLSIFYRSNTAKVAPVLFRKTNGKWARWTVLAPVPKSSAWRKATVRTPVVPAGTTNIRWGLSIYGKGTLVTDDYAMFRKAAPGPTGCNAGEVCTKGQWKIKVVNAPVRGIHSVLMRNGKVLLIEGSGGQVDKFAAKTFTTKVYDPATDRFATVRTPDDLFCAGHVQLPDGRILVLSGTRTVPDGSGNAENDGFTGLKKSYIFDPATNKYTQTNNPIDGHWYPSATALGNGDVFSAGGHSAVASNAISPYVERFSWAKKQWLSVNEVKQNTELRWGTYPSMVLMQDGRLFYTGSSAFGDGSYFLKNGANGDTKDRQNEREFFGPGVYNMNTANFTAIGGLAQPTHRDQSASVLLPPAQNQKVLTLGGGNAWNNQAATNSANIIDLRAGNPRYRATKGGNIPHGMVDMDMADAGQAPVPQTGNEGKMYVSAVILPDGNVLETGGGMHLKANPVYEASLFNPATEKFTPVAADPVQRLYHSSAILLPDGRVLAVGSENAAQNFDHRMSIYSPPYLFKGARPVITSAKPKKSWAYGSTQTIGVNQGIRSAVLIRPAAVTHSSDPNQRSVNLPIVKSGGGKIKVKLDPRRNLTPPGWYMLFVTGKTGIPSVAQWVHVG